MAELAPIRARPIPLARWRLVGWDLRVGAESDAHEEIVKQQDNGEPDRSCCHADELPPVVGLHAASRCGDRDHIQVDHVKLSGDLLVQVRPWWVQTATRVLAHDLEEDKQDLACETEDTVMDYVFLHYGLRVAPLTRNIVS